MKILLIIPAYNEEQTILQTVRNVRGQAFPDEWQVDFVVVNDGSLDRTHDLCRENGLPCLSLCQNLGIGGAVQTGYLYAAMEGYDIAVQFDGDGQHDIASLAALVAPVAAGELDFAVGSRFIGTEGGFRSTPLRQAGIRYLSWLICRVTGLKIADVTSGYRAAGRRAIAYLAENYPIDYPEPESLVRLYRQGFAIGEVPVNMFPRSGGASSIGSIQSVYYIMKVTLAVLCAAAERKEERE